MSLGRSTLTIDKFKIEPRKVIADTQKMTSDLRKVITDPQKVKNDPWKVIGDSRKMMVETRKVKNDLRKVIVHPPKVKPLFHLKWHHLGNRRRGFGTSREPPTQFIKQPIQLTGLIARLEVSISGQRGGEGEKCQQSKRQSNRASDLPSTDCPSRKGSSARAGGSRVAHLPKSLPTGSAQSTARCVGSSIHLEKIPPATLTGFAIRRHAASLPSHARFALYSPRRAR